MKLMFLCIKSNFLPLKNLDFVEIECQACKRIFKRRKSGVVLCLKQFKGEMNHVKSKNCRFCSRRCRDIALGNIKKIKCDTCGKELVKPLSQIKRFKTHFCNPSCNAIYRNTHKTQGYRRSKLETWIEVKLIEKYPNLEFHFNRRDTINSELDIYIPFLKLAFELNGISHYEPIYGKEKLEKVKNNDNRKFQACLEKQIELCLIDTCELKNFKEHRAQKYLDIIVSIINKKIGVS